MAERPFLAEVKRQYESFPYPPRDPADESRRLIHNIPGSLLAINHHCFRGCRDFRSGFRALVAGGGTGDTTIFLAEQLRHFDSEVVYLDLSAASREIAEARAHVRGLGNITWLTGSIMELPRLGLGEFDYIECCGVLHHLESTEAGLQALNAVLKEDGAIFLMLYAKYGRRAVYDMQLLLRSFLPEGLTMEEKVRLTRRLLGQLPESNSFLRDFDRWRFEISTEGFGDTGLYDLLLHSQDRCFDVPGLYELARSAGLHLLDFAVRADAYDPLNHVTDQAVRRRLSTFELPRRQALAEQFVGNICMHEFFLARQPNRSARLSDENNTLRSYGSMLTGAARLAAEMVPAPGRMVSYTDQSQRLQIPCTPITRMVFAHMDGLTSLRALRKRIRRTVPGVTAAMVDREIEQIYKLLHPRGYLYLISAGSYGVKVPDYEKLMTGHH